MAEQSIPGGPYVLAGVRERIYDHVFSSPHAEVGGVLVGHLRLDGSPRITGIIPALEAEGARSRVTFTHEAWSTIHATLDRDHHGDEILGWYHSHPGFGIFLSEHDLFIHRNFFARPEQIAIVVDPHIGSEGLFVWRDGEVVKAGEEPTTRPGERPEEVERILANPEPARPPRGALAFYLLLGMLAGALAWIAFLDGGGGAKSPRQGAVAGGSAPRCRYGQVDVGDAGSGGVAAGTLAEAIAFRVGRRCHLSGLPSVWLLSRAGRRLAVVPPDPGSSGGPFVLEPHHPLYANLYYENPGIRPRFCRLQAFYMAIRPPGGGRRRRVAFQSGSLRLCPDGFRVTGLGQGRPISY